MKTSDSILAAKALGAKDYARVIEHSEAELEEDPDNFAALYRLAVAHERLNNPDQVLEYVNRGLAIMPNDYGFLMIAARYWAKSNPHLAYEYATRIAEHPPGPMPGFARLVMMMANGLIRLVSLNRRRPSALSAYDKSVERNLNWVNEYRAWYQTEYGVGDEATMH